MKLPSPSVRFVLREEPLDYVPRAIPLNEPDKIAEFYKMVVATDTSFEPQKENLIVVAVNTKANLIGYNIVSVGTLDSCSAHPREIFRPLITCAAYGFILIHNHPSGDPSPSRADRVMTNKMAEVAEIIGIRLYDHIIMGGGQHFSFRDNGLID